MSKKKINQSNRTSRSNNQTISKQSKTRNNPSYKNSIIRKLFTRQQFTIQGSESESFNRREYQLPIESLTNINKRNIGFTNNILIQKDDVKKIIHLFVPAYVSIKLKSIHKIEIKDLYAEINCNLIIILLVDGLGEQLKKLLQQRVMIQINRGDSFQLAVKEDSTKVVLKKQNTFFKFIVRDVFPVEIDQDVFLSPFEILNLVLTVTVNSIFVPPQLSLEEGYKLKISFNCMRNPQKMSISYVSQCSFGVYGVAEKKLAHYPSNLATYQEVKKQFIYFASGNTHNSSVHNKNDKKQSCKYNIVSPRSEDEVLYQKDWKKHQKKLTDKIKYYQYSHFVIPLYKYPGNAWSTIFIPVIMLALLSISLFFNKSTLQERNGTIATIVLGFIALIPSIKSELPPSQKITLSESIVYIETINCMLSLVENAFSSKSHFWKLSLFYISVIIHIVCVGTAVLLLILHKFWWQPKYNISQRALELGPSDDKQAWNNPYCDEYFLRQNEKKEFKVQIYRDK